MAVSEHAVGTINPSVSVSVKAVRRCTFYIVKKGIYFVSAFTVPAVSGCLLSDCQTQYC